jgi:hypothetical protein
MDAKQEEESAKEKGKDESPAQGEDRPKGKCRWRTSLLNAKTVQGLQRQKSRQMAEGVARSRIKFNIAKLQNDIKQRRQKGQYQPAKKEDAEATRIKNDIQQMDSLVVELE